MMIQSKLTVLQLLNDLDGVVFTARLPSELQFVTQQKFQVAAGDVSAQTYFYLPWQDFTADKTSRRQYDDVFIQCLEKLLDFIYEQQRIVELREFVYFLKNQASSSDQLILEYLSKMDSVVEEKMIEWQKTLEAKWNYYQQNSINPEFFKKG